MTQILQNTKLIYTSRCAIFSICHPACIYDLPHCLEIEELNPQRNNSKQKLYKKLNQTKPLFYQT